MELIEKLIEIPVADDTKIPSVITEPKKLKIRATAVLSHGIFSDKNENGRFVRQSAILSEKGIRTIRFDFRGHGEHKLPPHSCSIIGMLIDFATVMEYANISYNEPLVLVASSFGASIALLYYQTVDYIRPKKTLLLNPVVDYHNTFIEPEGPDMQDSFNQANWFKWNKTGTMSPNPDFQINRVFGYELMTLRPYIAFENIEMPMQILHGTADKSVSFDKVKLYSINSKMVDFQPIEGADHAFDEPWEEKVTFKYISDWFERIP